MFSLLGSLKGNGNVRKDDDVLGDVAYEIEVHEEVAIGMIFARGVLTVDGSGLLTQLVELDGPLVLVLEDAAGEVTFGVLGGEGSIARIEVRGHVPGF